MNSASRRDFLKQASIAAWGVGAAGFAAGAAGAPDSGDELRVQLASPDDPGLQRALELLQNRIGQRSPVRIVEAVDNVQLVIAIDNRLASDAFRLDDAGSAIRIAGGSARGLLYGIGKFLRTSGYGGTFQPSAWRGIAEPQGTLRGMYFASHFHNWYHQATEAEIARYVEDLSLWGMNALMAVFPMMNLRGWDDPEAAPAMEMLRRYGRVCRNLDIQFATGITNAMFSGAPDAIRATPLPDPTGRRGNHGFPVCPSNPDGHAYLMENTRRLFEELKQVGLDILVFWPYDEGGCACEQCSPWGSNGYLKLAKEQASLGREYFPNLKTVLSTWVFDTPPEGEWQGLADDLARGNGWLNYILADAHEDFPRYPLDVGVPGGLPLINFPEISMWGNSPWGGVGAHPLPGRYQRLWDQVKHVVTGGFPYSEGIYEDMNKAAVLQFYWERDRSARDTLAEYAAYEFGAGTGEDVLAVVDGLEAAASAAFRKETVDIARVLETASLAEAIHGRLPDWGRANWRWEILYLRAMLDRERFAGDGLESDAAQAAMLRLCEIYHCQIETDDPYHHRVRPKLKQAVSRAGNK